MSAKMSACSMSEWQQSFQAVDAAACASLLPYSGAPWLPSVRLRPDIDRLIKERDDAVALKDRVIARCNRIVERQDMEIAELKAEVARARERDASFVRAIKRIAGAVLLLGIITTAHAQSVAPKSAYVPPAIAFANQALQCDSEVIALNARVAELEKQLADAKAEKKPGG